MYTSGSTGRPKGVAIEHRGLANYLGFAVRNYGLTEGNSKGCGALLFSSIGFDLTVTTLFAPLLSGKAVCILPPGDEISLLAEELRRRRGYTFLKLTPSHLALLERLLSIDELVAAARVLVLGGEPWSYEAVSALLEHPDGPRIVNEYGPTETVVGCCVYELARGAVHSPVHGPVPIGRPIDNTRLHVLDRNLALVPIGAVGELFIGGVQLARGYWNRPDLDAERFAHVQFEDSSPGGAPERLYRTGDLARWRSDGTLEFLGRVDRQVKLRGYRIELGEIESALRQHPAVREAVVALRKEPSERLVAYVTRAADASDDVLRAYLAERLPKYMVPAAFVSLDELPLTAHGKVDVDALHARDTAASRLAHSAPSAHAPAPATPREKVLAAIFCEVLGLPAIGVHEPFFRSGGDSMSSILVVAKAKQAGLDVTLPQLFQHPTVHALARVTGELVAQATEVRGAETGPSPSPRKIARACRARWRRRIRPAPCSSRCCFSAGSMRAPTSITTYRASSSACASMPGRGGRPCAR